MAGNQGEFLYMGRSFDSSGAFSECNSDCTGEFSTPGSPISVGSDASGGKVAALQRLLISCAPDNSDEVILGLVSDLETLTDSIDLQRHAVMEIRLLAKHNPENRLKIARAGAVRPLISLLSHPDPVLQENGVAAILNLSLCDENKYTIAAAGGIKPLVRVLKTGTTSARENAACALLRLSQIDEHKVTIGLAGAIPHLVNLLQTGGSRAKKDASTALFSLCTTKENKIRAVQAGIVRPLLDLMSEPELGMVDKAAYVLFNIVSVHEGRVAAVEDDCIPVLVELVEVGSQRQKEIAAATLLLICEDSASCRSAVVREGAIPPLVALSQSGSSRAKQKVGHEHLKTFGDYKGYLNTIDGDSIKFVHLRVALEHLGRVIISRKVDHGISSRSSKAVENEAPDEDLHQRGSFNLLQTFSMAR
ncbi:U-box domain-containing protein 4 [Platanthera guangdongensis]|uniref:U-box domain-containing protein 4 n=1 Tax=Platanthera guangdongensis TaxID=2320717 RepID=A0ABR2LM77_9ASPA